MSSRDVMCRSLLSVILIGGMQRKGIGKDTFLPTMSPKKTRWKHTSEFNLIWNVSYIVYINIWQLRCIFAVVEISTKYSLIITQNTNWSVADPGISKPNIFGVWKLFWCPSTLTLRLVVKAECKIHIVNIPFGI